jgi:hypothetical protein
VLPFNADVEKRSGQILMACNLLKHVFRVRKLMQIIVELPRFLDCQYRAIPYTRASLLNKRPFSRRGRWSCLLAGHSMPTLLLFPSLIHLNPEFLRPEEKAQQPV